MCDKSESKLVGEVLIVLVIVLLAALFLYAVSANAEEVRDLKTRAKSLEAEVATLKRAPAPPDRSGELTRLAEDIAVCHQRATDIWDALGVVARTVPGRARPPRIPRRQRPLPDKGESNGRLPGRTEGAL